MSLRAKSFVCPDLLFGLVENYLSKLSPDTPNIFVTCKTEPDDS